MEDKSAQLQKAFQLRKEGKYKEALDIYEPMYQQFPLQFGPWEGWSFAWVLKALGKYEECLEKCRDFFRKYPNEARIKQLYAWAVYYTQLQDNAGQTGYSIRKKAVEAILKLSPAGTPFGCAERSVFKTVKYLATQNPPDWPEINRWLDHLQPEGLSLDTYSFEREGGKKTELASDREEWYSWKSKALLQLERWEECLAACDEAVTQIRHWHYSNEIWFERRKAAALVKLGRKAEARQILEKLVTKRKEWFLALDLAELEDNPEKALDLCREAALMRGEAEKKIRLFHHMISLSEKTGQASGVEGLVKLCLSIRHHQNWPVPAELEEKALMYAANLLAIEKPEYYLEALEKEWRRLFELRNPNYTGIIQKIMPDGRSGFIKTEGGKHTIYFSTRDWAGKLPVIKQGMRVTFKKQLTWDKVKNCESEKAVHLRLPEAKASG